MKKVMLNKTQRRVLEEGVGMSVSLSWPHFAISVMIKVNPTFRKLRRSLLMEWIENNDEFPSKTFRTGPEFFQEVMTPEDFKWVMNTFWELRDFQVTLVEHLESLPQEVQDRAKAPVFTTFQKHGDEGLDTWRKLL